ncbi:MAG: hypothetical protein P4L90_25980 [Rhodopila sp.]|nr:hypothetical protein [Rhodopila sp.]
MSALRCSVCSSPDWVSCAPGTSADAQQYRYANVADLHPAEEVPMQVWCSSCWPWRKESAA